MSQHPTATADPDAAPRPRSLRAFLRRLGRIVESAQRAGVPF